MSKKTFIHAENNHNILSSNEVRLYNPPKPEELKVIIWGKELCNGAEWNDFLKCVEDKTKEIDQLKQQLDESFTEEDVNGLIEDRDKTIKFLQQQLDEKQNTIDEINKEFVQAVHDWKTLCAEKDKEIEKLKQQYTILENENGKLTTELIMDKYKKAQKEVSFGKQLAIQELEKVNTILYESHYKQIGNKYYAELEDIESVIDQQIKLLKGEEE